MAAQLTVGDVSARLAQQFGANWAVDKALGAGSDGTVVTGIAVTFSPTYDVIARASAKRANLVVSLEPPFWSGPAPDNSRPPGPAELEPDPTYRLKRARMDAAGIAVLSVRDGWTRRPEDGQLRGLARALGWERYHRPAAGTMEWAPGNHHFTLPGTRFGALARDIMKKLGARAPRCIGDPQIAVADVALTHGYMEVPDLQKVLAGPKLDVVICGEACEWEVVPYFMDLIASGQKKGMILLGNQVSSEPGCRELAEWVRGVVNEVPVEWLPAGEPFHAAV